MNYLLIFILLVTFSFSQTKEEIIHDEKVRKEARAELLLELKKKYEENHLVDPSVEQSEQFDKVGLMIKENKITLDMNKTQNFFKNLVDNFAEKIEKLNRDIEKSIESPQEIGIDITQDSINIDINKSKKYFNGLKEKMQNFINEFDTISKDMGILEK